MKVEKDMPLEETAEKKPPRRKKLLWIVGGVVKLVAISILSGNPDIGILGAPIGSLLCYVCITVLNLICMKRIFENPPAIVRNVLKSVLAAGMTMYPQQLKNVVVTDKDETLNCEEVKSAVRKVEADLGDEGRVVLRKSGTEPLLRVMVEATSDALCEEKVDEIIAAMQAAGKLIKVK